MAIIYYFKFIFILYVCSPYMPGAQGVQDWVSDPLVQL